MRLHLARHLAEPHHVGAHGGFAAPRAEGLDGQILRPRRAYTAGGAQRALKLAMHVNEVLRAGCLVQRVDVLGDGENVAVLALEPGKGEMGGVGPRLFVPGAAEIVEAMHENWVAGEAFGRRHVLDPEVLPKPARASKGAEAALGR